MANLSLRGLDETTFEQLKNDAHQHGISVNRRIIELLQERMGTKHISTGQNRQRQQSHHDLDSLAGTWSVQDVKDFQDATAAFSEIDYRPMAQLSMYFLFMALGNYTYPGRQIFLPLPAYRQDA